MICASTGLSWKRSGCSSLTRLIVTFWFSSPPRLNSRLSKSAAAGAERAFGATTGLRHSMGGSASPVLRFLSYSIVMALKKWEKRWRGN
jgi:hypothetical protein